MVEDQDGNPTGNRRPAEDRPRFAVGEENDDLRHEHDPPS
jgi:hypothetical protein